MRRSAFVVLAVSALLSSGLAPAPAYAAGSSVGSFEIDGNLVDTSPGEPIDWSTPPPNLTNFTDRTGATDDSFNTGSKELEPGTWDCRIASAPGKDDITAGQVAFRTVGGDQFVYVDYTRAAVNGDAHIDYEFNQGTAKNPACPDLPQRTNGDIVITFDTEQGGKKIFVRAFRWAFTGTSTTVGTLKEVATGSQGVTYDGAVNIPNSIPGHIDGDFGEAALNLTKTIGAISCGQFATAYMKSRASTSISAALKDRTATQPVNVGECPKSSLAKQVRNVTTGGTFGTTATAGPGDTLEYQLVYKNAGSVPATGVVVTDTIQPKQMYVANSCTGPPICSVSGSTLTWNLGTVEAGGSRTMTFQTVLDKTFAVGTTLVKNVGMVDTNEETPKSSNETVVTVTASPGSSLAKAVRNVTDSGAFATTATADPGDTLEYQLVYRNGGNAAASDVVVTDTLQAGQTFVSCTLSCTVSGQTLTWNLGTAAPGETRTMLFVVKLDSSFPAGTFTIKNTGVVDTAEEAPKTSNETVVTGTAAPLFTLVKSADKTSVSPGGTVTWTLTYKNSGNAPATNVVITDTLPAGTTFQSCSPAVCSNSGNTVTWTVGTVPAGGGGSVSVTALVTETIACEICNIGQLTSTGGFGATSNKSCVTVVPVADPGGANASGSASGAIVHVSTLIDQTLPASTGGVHDHTSVDSAQSGVGAKTETKQVLTANPPVPADVLQADVLRTTTTSTVTALPAASANATSVAGSAAVNVLNGVVTATLVRGVASATADGGSATVSSVGSVIEGLMIDADGAGGAPAVAQEVAPNTKVGLDPRVFGDNSYVAIYERVASTTSPTGSSGGTYASDLEVRMIHVHVTGAALIGAVDVIVGQAIAHADFPQTTVCGGVNRQRVSGSAAILDVQTDPSLAPVRVGSVQIPASGGSSSQTLNTATVDTTSTSTATSSSTGTLSATSSDASSFAEAQRVCVLKTATGCTVEARAVRSQANSKASSAGASSDALGTEFLGLKVAGQSFTAPVAPNTVVTLPGLGFVILNEQTCENGGSLATKCADGKEAGHTGLTVRAIHVFLLDPASGGTPGAEVIVAEAHSDAGFVKAA